MGRVFGFNEIPSGIPHSQDFTTATEVFREMLVSGVEAGAFDGGIIFGSVAVNRAGSRSDLDLLISLSDDTPLHWRAAEAVGRQINTRTFGRVITEPIVQVKQDLANGRHEMDRFFGEHLTGRSRIVVGNDPAEYIRFGDQPAGAILSSYLVQKKRRLGSAFAGNVPGGRELGLQRMLELPAAVGCKAVQALADIGDWEVQDNTADRSTLIPEATRLMDREGLAEEFGKMLKLNSQYDNLLADTRTGAVTEVEYNQQLQRIADNWPNALSWLRLVERTLLPRFEA